MKQAKWIWIKNQITKDQYAEFVDSFEHSNGKISIKVSCDSISAIYLNNKLVGFSQCSDYPNKKYYDEYDLTSSVKDGLNELRIQVWYMGVDSACYLKGDPCLIYEIENENSVLAYSNEKTKSRLMNEYKNGYCKAITIQLGISFAYDATVEHSNFDDSILVKTPDLLEKRLQKPLILEKRVGISIQKDGNRYLVDLGEETAGFLDIDFISDEEQDLLISYGEHLVDGRVPRLIGGRDFSVEYRAREGVNRYMNPFRRLAGRFLEFETQYPIEIDYIGIRPVYYPLNVIHHSFENPLDQRIFDACINTIRLCMHEHYEDCPWREQSFYAMDSRNQMLCGYDVFDSTEYQRSNLVLMSRGLRKDRLLSLTYPAGVDLPIPFFSLVFILQSYEYIKRTGDVTVLSEIQGTLKALRNTFVNRLDSNHLIPIFNPPEIWNFTEWAPYSDGTSDQYKVDSPNRIRYDLSLNCMFVYTMGIYKKLFPEETFDLEPTRKSIVEIFFDNKRKLFRVSDNVNHFTQLGNALAILAGVANKNIRETISKCEDDMVPATLSMRTFVYDALLESDDTYNEFVINDIRERYGKMLNAGSTTFWETEEGWPAFENAGSLCHGWSAIPIHYFCKLLK